MLLNFLLFFLIICLAAFLLNVYFQLARIESSLKALLANVEKYLVDEYGED